MMRFDENYREPVTLADGSRVVLRLVRPDDGELVRRGFERLSPESRYRRFLAFRTHLSDEELVYLTAVDGHDHFAMGAVTEVEGREEGVAIGRFIRTATNPRQAEVAVAVADAWQRRGVGTLLLVRLAAAARERGIDAFAGQTLVANEGMRDVLAQLDHGVTLIQRGPELAIQVGLDSIPAELPANHVLGRLCQHLVAPFRFSRGTARPPR